MDFVVPPRASPSEALRALEIALAAIRSDRVRTRAALVALGLSMAIVVCLTTLVERGRAATIRSLERAGLDNLYLVARRQTRPGAVADSLTRRDAERLAAIAPVRSIVTLRMQRRTMTAGGAPFTAFVYGVAGPWSGVLGARAKTGRLLGDLDVAGQSPFGVVGAQLPKLVGQADLVGRTVNAGGRAYEIVGQIAATTTEGATVGELPSLDWDRCILVPLGTEPEASDETAERYPVDVAVLHFADADQADRAAGLFERIDSERYGPQGSVRVASPIQTLRQYKQTRRTFDRIVWLVGLLAAASAVAAISNLLSASVVARAKEIGLRRAVGARSRDIVLQFQAEGLLLGVFGGGLGLLAGLVISSATADRSAAGSTLSFLSFSGLAVVCLILGIVAGLRPSRRASRIDPAEALREG